MVTLCGGTAVPVNGRAPELQKLKAYFKQERVTLLICDHHLFEHGDYAGYFGADAIAASYLTGIGGILVTAYEKDDAELSLRKNRRWIPEVIHSTQLNRTNMGESLLRADREVRQKTLARERVPYRTVMTIRRIETRGTAKIVKVVMSQWNATEEVGFPLDMVPEEIRPTVVPGNLLIAQVNVAAAQSDDLYFDQFELPDPDVLKKAKSLFDRP